MLHATLKGMFAHRLRVVLTCVSIALGVGFLAGTLILTSSLQRAFDGVIGSLAAGVDVVVRAEATVGEGARAQRPPLPAGTLAQVRGVDGVATAEGVIEGFAVVTDGNGKPLASPTATTLGGNWLLDDGLRGSQLRSGHAPGGPDEVVIDAGTARKGDLRLGDRVTVHFAETKPRMFRLVGTVGFGNEDDLGGAGSAYFDLPTARQVLDRPADFDSVMVAAAPGTAEADLARRVAAALPPATQTLTGAEVADEVSESVADQLTLITNALMAFAGVALFVGGFIIWNTFSMQVAQRSRELALLRAVGATRRQVLRAILAEAAVLGTIASALGVGLGFGAAKALTALMDAMGLPLPSAPLVLEPGTVVAGMVVGVAITMVAAAAPARRATRVLPVEALRDAGPGVERFTRRRFLAGALLSAAGLAALAVTMLGDPSLPVMAAGVAGVVLGVLVLAPALVKPMAAASGVLLRRVGITGDLARQNTVRNPRRTASTAMALVIGLTLVTGVAVFASSLKATLNDAVDDSVRADLFVMTSMRTIPGFSTAVARDVAAVDGVRTVSPAGYEMARVNAETAPVASVDPATVTEALDLDVVEGSMGVLERGDLMLSAPAAETSGLGVGDHVDVAFTSGRTHTFTIGGIFERQQFLGADYLLSNRHLDRFVPNRLDSKVLVVADDGTDVRDVEQRLDVLLRDRPDATVMDKEEFQGEMSGIVNQLLTVVTVLLLLAVVIALLGIVNTLALSVFERTRELGLLRAVGMTRRQIRAMVRWESVMIAGMGTVLGAALGVGLGVTLVRALADDGLDRLAVPVWQLLGYVLAAAVAGVLAAIGPARRAAKVDVLKAVVAD